MKKILLVMLLALCGEVFAQTPSAPILSSPSNGSNFTVSPTGLTFSWNTATTITMQYNLSISTSADFSSTIYYNGVATSPRTKYIAGLFSSNKKYYWRVRGLIGSYGPWSSVWGFSTAVTIVPTLTSPSNGATIKTDTVTLTWGSIACADSYEVWIPNIGAMPGNASPHTNYPLFSKNYFQQGGTFTWKVRAKIIIWGAWTPIWTFTEDTTKSAVLPTKIPNKIRAMQSPSTIIQPHAIFILNKGVMYQLNGSKLRK